MRRFIRPRARVGLAALFVMAAATMLGGSSVFASVSGAVQTTDDPNTSHWCAQGPHKGSSDTTLAPAVNCNIYDVKADVWINGGPTNGTSKLTDGYYFFAVLEPGGQPDPNDGGAKNLSDVSTAGGTDDNNAGDDVTNRVFHVQNAQINSYGGTHGQDNFYQGTNGLLIQLAPFDTTSNPGGVYILAVCFVGTSVPSTISVTPSSCKYDAFKVKESETQAASGATVSKDAAGAYNTTFTWDIAKSADKTLVQQVGGTATFEYTVHVTHDPGSDPSDVTVTGTITVLNPNLDGNGNTVPLDITSVTDELSDGTPCDVTGGGAQTLTNASTTFAYSCSLLALPQGNLDNTVTVTWPTQDLSTGHVVGGSDVFTFSAISFTQNKVDDCTTVTDPVPAGGTSNDNPFPTTVCVGDAGDGGAGTGTTDGFTFVYHTTYNVPASGCLPFTNTATESTDGHFGSVTVQVCGPAHTGALTMGFWKNTNGQTLIKYYCSLHTPTLATYLSTLGGNSTGPFAGAAGQSCTGLMAYTTDIFKKATATNMNYMLRAQILATALDVYFSSTGYQTGSVNKTKPPSNFLPNGGIGTFNMDMTAICPMVDNTTAGTATCKLGLPSTDAFASGAVPAAAMTVDVILAFAASNPPYTTSGSPGIWYAGNRTKQEILKNIFDQINNQDAFSA